MRPLLSNFRPLIRSKSNQFAGRVEIPPASVHAEFNKQFVRAVKTYDPNKGAALGTWVSTNLRKGQRWITAHQNIARIGEQRVYKVGRFNAAKSRLDEELGREPTTLELAEDLGMSEREVGTLRTEIRQANISSGFELDPVEILPSKEKEALRFVNYELTPEERLVKEYLLGENGRPELKQGQIAKKMGVSPSKVTRLKQSIAKKLQPLL